MKICDVTQFYSPVSGGVKRYISEKRRYVADQTGDEHHLIVPGPVTHSEQTGRLHLHTVKSPRLDFFSRYPSRYRLLLNTRRVRDLLDEIRPQIIESGDPYHLAWTTQRMGRELHLPVFGFYHSHFPDAYLRTMLKYGGTWLKDAAHLYARDYILRLYSRFALTFVPSEHLRQLLEDWGLTNTVTLNLGVDTTAFTPGPADAALRQELGLPPEATLLLYVGRLAPDKNLATLLQAFTLLCADYPGQYHLLIVGDGPQRRLLAETRQKTGALTWKSYIQNNEELACYYRLAQLFVHPGICETFGLVILEAQACGLPCVGFRGSFMDANVMTGLPYWAREKTPASLARAIHTFQGLDLAALGQEASGKVHERFSWSQVFRRQWDYYTRTWLHGSETYRPGPAAWKTPAPVL